MFPLDVDSRRVLVHEIQQSRRDAAVRRRQLPAPAGRRVLARLRLAPEPCRTDTVTASVRA